jgi:hypothetical protein
MRVVPFQPDHVLRLALQPMQLSHEPPMSVEVAATLAKVGPSYAAVEDDGTVLAAAGIIPQWEGRAIAWALIAHNAGPHFVRITREVRRFLDGCGFARVEAAVDAFFPAAIRWAELLGFERETPEPMRAYGLNRRPAYLYARVRED